MMKATMTDVQKAIEQLGHGDGGEDGDGARSFSFASTRDGEITENSDTEFDLSDFDGTEINGNRGEDWHKGARRKLAAKAKQAVEEAEKLEAMTGENENGRRAIAPPIEVDFSDESEAEDDADDQTKSTNVHRNHPHIPEEDENAGTDGEATAATNGTRHSLSTDVVVPLKDEADIPTATKPSFPISQSPVPTDPLPTEPEEKLPTTEKDVYPSPISPPTTTLPNIQQILKRSSTPVREISNGLPSPTSFGHISSKHNSMISSSSAPGMLVNSPQVQQQQPNGTSVFTRPASIPVSTTAQGRNETPPTEWNVNDVVDWLKSKGFDQDVCDKFTGECIIPFCLTQKQILILISFLQTEQEITGDVLLELDVNLLKSEIGIMAFGKRMRIANAITDLRRPPSIEYSDHQLSPTQLHPSNSLTNSHSRTQSQSHSLPGTTPSSTVGHVYSYNMQNSLGITGVGYGSRQSGHSQDSPVNINDDMKAAAPVDSGTAGGVTAGMSAAAGVGLGIALSPMNAPSEVSSHEYICTYIFLHLRFKKGPPSRLLLSSSSTTSKESAVKTVAVNAEDEERGHMSDVCHTSSCPIVSDN